MLLTDPVPSWAPTAYLAMRPCLNELQKEYCVTLISRVQMNRLGHSSPVMHKDEGKTHTILEKLKIASGKSTLFWHFLWSIFRSPVLTSEFLLIQILIPPYFIHIWLRVHLVFALLLAVWWLNFLGGLCEWKSKKL